MQKNITVATYVEKAIIIQNENVICEMIPIIRTKTEIVYTSFLELSSFEQNSSSFEQNSSSFEQSFSFELCSKEEKEKEEKKIVCLYNQVGIMEYKFNELVKNNVIIINTGNKINHVFIELHDDIEDACGTKYIYLHESINYTNTEYSKAHLIDKGIDKDKKQFMYPMKILDEHADKQCIVYLYEKSDIYRF